MTYQIIRDAKNNIVYSGPNDGSVNPYLADGQVLTIEDNTPPPDTSATDARAAAKKSAYKKLAALGLTAAEIAAL